MSVNSKGDFSIKKGFIGKSFRRKGHSVDISALVNSLTKNCFTNNTQKIENTSSGISGMGDKNGAMHVGDNNQNEVANAIAGNKANNQADDLAGTVMDIFSKYNSGDYIGAMKDIYSLAQGELKAEAGRLLEEWANDSQIEEPECREMQQNEDDTQTADNKQNNNIFKANPFMRFNGEVKNTNDETLAADKNANFLKGFSVSANCGGIEYLVATTQSAAYDKFGWDVELGDEIPEQLSDEEINKIQAKDNPFG